MFRMLVDISGPMMMFTAMQSPSVMDRIGLGVGEAALLTQADMKDQLNSMIYSKPETRYYKRTFRLYRGAHAAMPGNDHSTDDSSAETSDMAASSASAIVAATNGVYMSEVGDWVSYAWFVHEGYGLGLRATRPFSAQPTMNAEGHMLLEVNQALADALSGIVP